MKTGKLFAFGSGVMVLAGFLSCSAFAEAERSVYDLLSSKGFSGGKGFLVCAIKNDNVVKNINQDVPILLDKLKKVVVAKGVAGPSDYTIWLSNGSSFDLQTVVISVGKTGNGYVQYLKEERAFFKSVDLYEFCVTAFNKSKILIERA